MSVSERNFIMLKIYLGEMKGAIYHPPTYFDNCYEDEWLTTPLAKEMIRDVDRSEVISAHLIDSPVLGPIPPKDLSGGIKTLLLMAYDTDGKIFNASVCGDNCAKWLLKIAETEDRTINLRHLMKFEVEPFDIRILNTNEIVHTMEELVSIAGEFV